MGKELNSILDSVKSQLNVPLDVTEFDTDIIININSALNTLNQLGVGPKEAFAITGSRETYDDFLDDPTNYQMVKMYLFEKTKLGFDSSSMSSSLLDFYQKDIAEKEWRLREQAEHGGA